MTLTPITTSKVVWWTLMRGCTKQWFNYAPFSVESPSIVDQLMKLKETWYPPTCIWPPLVAAKKWVENHAVVSSLWSIYLTFVRSSCLELSHGELDMAIMGQLVAGMNTSPTVSVAAWHNEVDREKMYTALFHQGKPVCLRMFQFIHTVGKKWLQNLMGNVKENCLAPRVYCNLNRIPKYALSLTSTEYVVRFLYSYAEQNALLLPGRIPGYTRTDLQLLPSSVSVKGVWRVYHEATELDDSIHTVAYSTFCYLWRVLVLSVVVMKTRSDLCWQYQQNSTAITRTGNSSDSEKSSSLLSSVMPWITYG